MLCSVDEQLAERLNEYAEYPVMSGWPSNGSIQSSRKAHHREGRPSSIAHRIRGSRSWHESQTILQSQHNQTNSSYPVFKSPENANFPKTVIISADRKRENLGERFKLTAPGRFPRHGPNNKPGFLLFLLLLHAKPQGVTPDFLTYRSSRDLGTEEPERFFF